MTYFTTSVKVYHKVVIFKINRKGREMKERRAYSSKRLFDIIFVSVALVIFSPLMLIIGISVFLFSGGWPIFFCHERAGLNGTKFLMFKFRTMVEGAELLEDEVKDQNCIEKPYFNIVDDPRLTWLGKFLKKTNLDELPQLLNVLIGEMSLVGPRPVPLKYSDNCKFIVNYLAKPGITSPYSLIRKKNNINVWNYDDTLKGDRKYYGGNQTMFKDFMYIVKTVFLVVNKICLAVIGIFKPDKFQIITVKTALKI